MNDKLLRRFFYVVGGIFLSFSVLIAVGCQEDIPDAGSGTATETVTNAETDTSLSDTSPDTQIEPDTTGETGPGDTEDTTPAYSTESDTAGQNAEPITTDATDGTGVPDEDTATGEPEETQRVLESLDCVCDDWSIGTRTLFTELNQTRVTATDEGVNFKYVGNGQGADPHVMFNIDQYLQKAGKPALSGKQGAVVVFRYKATNTDGLMQVFTHAPAAGDSANLEYDPDGEWHFGIVDMSSTTLVKPEKLTKMRIDWTSDKTLADASMTVSHIAFFASYDEALAWIGSSRSGQDGTTVSEIDFNGNTDVTNPVTAQDATVAFADDTQLGRVVRLTGNGHAARIYINTELCAGANDVRLGAARYCVIRLNTSGLGNPGDEVGISLFSVSDGTGKVIRVEKETVLPVADGWQGILFDLRDVRFLDGTVSKISLKTTSALAQGSTLSVGGVIMTPDLNTALEAAGHAEYCLRGHDTLSFVDTMASSPVTLYEGGDGISVWFDHITEKIGQADTVSTGKTGYTVFMAKNETEDAQLFISPDKDMKIAVTVDAPQDAAGHTLDVEVFYEFYHNIENQRLPDALIPMSVGDASVSVKAGTSQGFVIAVTTREDTAEGDYTATVRITDAGTGKQLQSVLIKVHVWNFALTEKTTLRTAFAIWGDYLTNSYRSGYEGVNTLYQRYYDSLLAHRINGTDLPFGYSSSRGLKYLANPRVNTFRLYTDMDVSELDEWPEYKDKIIYYYVDEIDSNEKVNMLAVKTEEERRAFPKFRQVSPFYMNPYLTADNKITNNPDTAAGDLLSYMVGKTQLWCGKMDAFTTRDLGFYGGTSFLQTREQDARYGTYAARMAHQVELGDELWAYICINPTEPYVNWQIKSDGTETVVTMWQLKEYNVTGLLYWAVDYWRVNYWDTEKPWTGSAYGDGMLYYSGYSFDTLEPIGTIRLETLRDGIEDYEMLTMLENLCGREAVDNLISMVTTSVVTYTDNDDILHAVRVLLGETVEQAMKNR